jgi:hypothetical protein
MTQAVLDERRHEGLNWMAYARVERFSVDQTRWAEQRLATGFPQLAIAPAGLRQGRLAELLRSTGEPEDGIAEASGNLLVTVGLARITNLITGGGGQAFNNAQGTCGVGNVSTAAAVGDTTLGANGASAYYQGLDATFPSTSNGVINAQSTFASGNANFAWNEWCWATGVGSITPGASSGSIYGTGASFTMLNHKIASLGTKGSGAAWVFSTSTTLS